MTWLYTLLHLALTFSLPFLLLAVTGCQNENSGKPPEYGPQVQEQSVDQAVIEAIMDADPKRIKVGAFVHFATKQYLAGGLAVNVVSDTGHTVTAATEAESTIDYRIVEHKVTYGYQDGPRKVSTEFNLTVAKPKMAQLSSLINNVHAQATTPVTVTYHGLKTSTYKAPPPARVREQPNCLGLPDCLMTYRKITFNEVYHTGNSPQKVSYEFIISPDAPPTAGYNFGIRYAFLPGLMKSCFTLMVPIGDGDSRTLFTQCQEVENFRLESTPP